MLPNATNILDQLLGGFETQPYGQIGSSRGTDGSGPAGQLFGDLLGQMLGGVNSVDTVLPQNIQSLFPPNDRPLAQDGASAGPTVEAIQLIGVNPDALGVALLNQDPSAKSPDAVDNSEITVSQEARLPFVDLSAARLNISSSPGVTVDPLAPDTYDILDANIEDGQLELLLAPQGEAGEPIKVSLPLSVLAEALSEKVVKGDTASTLQAFVNLTANNKSLDLDTLFKSLNLKTLEINDAVVPSESDAASKPLELTLIGENQGARLAITARIKRQDLLVKSDGNQPGDDILASTETVIPEENGTPGDASPEEESDAHQMLFKKSLSDGFGSLTKNATADGKLFSLDALTSVDGSGKLAPRAGSVQNSVTATPVKLTLPDTITKPFFSQGQTIMIRIEPEHLGPARLNLTVHDQMLTARVTVDTPTAKLTVESSLNQLTDQLTKAGIQVDRIDVVLSDNGAAYQFHDQRPLWSQARRMRHIKDNNESNSDISTAPITMLPPRQYLGMQSVNLLA
jgi:hypothetical protein